MKIGNSVTSNIERAGIGIITAVNFLAQTVQVRFPRISVKATFTLSFNEVQVLTHSPIFSQQLIQEAEEIFYNDRESGLFQKQILLEEVSND